MGHALFIPIVTSEMTNTCSDICRYRPGGDRFAYYKNSSKRVTFSDLAQFQLKLRFFISSSILELNFGIMARTGRTAATFQLLSDYELDELMGGIDSPRDR